MKPHPHFTGRDAAHTIDLRKLAQDAAQLHAKVLSADGAIVCFANDLAQTLDEVGRFRRAEMNGKHSVAQLHIHIFRVDRKASYTGPFPGEKSPGWIPWRC